MRGITGLAAAAIVLLTPALASATANYVYHEQTTNVTGGSCPVYLTTPAPGPSDTYGLAYKIEYQTYTDTTVVYYTTDGSMPGGSYGVATGTSQVLTSAYACTFVFGATTTDVATATIPAQAAGTTVSYIVSAWHTPTGGGGGPEVFANSGTCSGCTPCEMSSCATVFSYTVATPPSDAGAEAAAEAGVDAEADAGVEAAAEASVEAGPPDAGAEAASDASADAGNDAEADAGVDAGVDAGEDAGHDSGAMVDAGHDAGADAAMAADTGSPGQDAAMMADASMDSTVSGEASDDASEDAYGGPNFALPGDNNGCGCSLPGAPGDLAGGAAGLYALLALVARVRSRRRR